MQELKEKSVVESRTDVSSSLEYGVYTIYDCVLKQFEPPFCLPKSKLGDYLLTYINDTSCKYYNHEGDFIVNKIGDFNQETGEVESHFVERICTLDKYIDDRKRKLQTIIQTLNFLPSGYFKMPVEQKQAIQEKIDLAIKKYVEDYVIPDMDVNTKQELAKNILSSN